MNRRFLIGMVLGASLSAIPFRRLAQDQYWGWRNRIWDKGWSDAWECAAEHMRAYEDTPEKYLAEHGFWWRDEGGVSA